MKKIGYILIFTSIFLASCATIFNSKRKTVTIVSNKSASIILEKDTLLLKDKISLKVPRQKEPMKFKIFNDSVLKNITVSSKNSFAYWSNLGIFYGAGMLIDKKNPKRYAYPSTIYIDMTNSRNTYSTIDSIKTLNGFNLKALPLNLISLINSGITINCEKRNGNKFSSQVGFTYLFPKSIMDINNETPSDIKGFKISLEEKFYLKKQAPFGLYLSTEFAYLKNQYKDIERFGKAYGWNDTINNNYFDTFKVNKQTYSINLKIGYQFYINRLSIDIFTGLGLRYKNVIHSDRLNPNDEMEIPREPNAYYFTNKEGKYWTVSFPLNIQIGWLF